MDKNEKYHPYLAGNFAPIQKTTPLTTCEYEGTIPSDLAGGEYVRNGGNPLTNEDLGRDAHWFDGDGMLSGVLFKRSGEKKQHIQPQFVNQYLVTDVYAYAKQNKLLAKPVLPSIATLVSPLTTWLAMILAVLRSVMLVLLSNTLGRRTIKKISVANTSVIYHDGRALATCESGPPLRFSLPALETVGWFNGRMAENEPVQDDRAGFGGDGVKSFMRQWTTAHPRVDQETGEFIAFHSTFVKPYVRYSIVKPSKGALSGPPLFEMPIPGIEAPRMMHDFGVSKQHTIIMDLPLSLDPMNHTRGLPSLCYDITQKSRFGVFPRYAPADIRWFETNPCLIFHTANSWDEVAVDRTSSMEREVVNVLACRLTSASMVFRAGNLPTPPLQAVPPEYVEDDQCRLYYYQFPLSDRPDQPAHISHQWSLSAIPFEFPTVSPAYSMRAAQFIYGCSTSESFTVALGKASKIDYLAKMNVKKLIAQGISSPPQSIKGCVDSRTIPQVLMSKDSNDPIQIFAMPRGWFAQEPCFVPRSNAETEDDGWLLTYVFDESQLDDRGRCRSGARSELWIIDAKSMNQVVAKIRLSQRVPYGLHGNWFSERDIELQKPFDRIREVDDMSNEATTWTSIRDLAERWLG